MDATNGNNWESAEAVLERQAPDLIASKQKLRRAEAIECVRLKRVAVGQNLGFASRPFVLCGLPVKRPAPGVLLHERRNGQFLLQVTGHPTYGLPWGQDRLVPIFLATRGRCTASKAKLLRFPVPPPCWIPLACTKGVPNTGA